MSRFDDDTQEDYEQGGVFCVDCGTSNGTFYQHSERENRHVCQDCLMNLPTQERTDFDAAVEKAENLTARERNGRIWIECAHCCETVGDFSEEDIQYATDLLDEDEEHECEREWFVDDEGFRYWTDARTGDMAMSERTGELVVIDDAWTATEEDSSGD